MKKFFTEFKEFAMRGNVIDMAVGVVIGAAFSTIVTSLVNDLITPLISLLTNSADFEALSITLRAATNDSPAVLLNIGVFLQALINFIIIAFAIFVVIKLMNRFKKPEEVVEAAPELPSEEVILLKEILSELKKK